MLKSKLLILAIFSTLCVSVYGQKKQAFRIYNNKGKAVSYKKLFKKIKASDVVLFGEFHNNPISHWLQLELTKDLEQSNQLILGAEMLEADNQQYVDDYLAGKINETELDSLARLWTNYKTDYAPLLEFAKEHQIAVVASNIPRRYASKVYREGGFSALDTLSAEELSWIAPRPIAFDPELSQYKKMLEMMGDHASDEIVMAQAVKDATMAHFILDNYKAGATFLHFNGAFHSDFHQGILWYLMQENNSLNYATITTVEQEDIHKLDEEHKGRADFIICVDEDMTKTY